MNHKHFYEWLDDEFGDELVCRECGKVVSVSQMGYDASSYIDFIIDLTIEVVVSELGLQAKEFIREELNKRLLQGELGGVPLQSVLQFKQAIMPKLQRALN